MQRPATVTWSIRMLLVILVLGAVAAVLVIVQRDELLAAWQAGHPDNSAIQPLSFVPVAVVLYVVVAGMILVLLPFVAGRHNWARHSLAAMIGLVALGTLAGLRTDPPTLFVICSVVSLVVDAVTLVLLWHPDTSAYLREPAAQVP